MKKEIKPTYIASAIRDWKEDKISRDRLFEIFRVNLFVGYGCLNDDDKAREVGDVHNILNKAIYETVMGELANA